ncbi:MAG: hypothetical protein Q7U12_08850 [Undibacterium sp.]|nr:hypothetical protein [Undibacterium sp.]
MRTSRKKKVGALATNVIYQRRERAAWRRYPTGAAMQAREKLTKG